MEQMLEDFITALRSTGVRISTSESIDAFNAIKIVGYNDKKLFKDSLLAILAKSLPEKELFEECFTQFFSHENYIKPDNSIDESKLVPDDQSNGIPGDLAPLTQMILSGDNAGLSVSMGEAARALEISGIQFFTQKGLYMMRIMNHMGIRELDKDIRHLSRQDDPVLLQKAEELKEAKIYLFNNVRDYVERQFSLFSGSSTEEVIEWYLRNVKLSNIEERDYKHLQKIIQKMVKKLNDKHSRRKKKYRLGQLDFKKTIRRNLIYQGIIFEPWWKQKKIERPEIITICDISRSVKTAVRFLLLFLYSLNDVVSKISSFIFCSNLAEVSDIFNKYPVEEALERVQSGNGIPIQLGSTDYGQTFLDFKNCFLNKVTKKTTIIILGDARNNFGNPQSEILKLMYKRCKRLIWLNPEQKSLWGTGDSEMKIYNPYCTMVKECNTVTQLERIVNDLVNYD